MSRKKQIEIEDEDDYDYEDEDNEEVSFSEQAKSIVAGDSPFQSLEELKSKANVQLQSFSALVDSLASLEDKQRALWKQIYENALEDRTNSHIMWIDLYNHVRNDAERHSIFGVVLSKYIERMSRANDQLIKLAEQISEIVDEEKEIVVSEEDIYEQIQKHNG